jgi:hypothetical protein
MFTKRTIRNRGESYRRSSAEGATGSALTCESRGVFQNHALQGAHTLACTRKIMIEEKKRIPEKSERCATQLEVEL